MVIITKRIVLNPNELHDIKRIIKTKISEKCENKLLHEGYVVKINKILNVSKGIIQSSPMSSVEYDVKLDVEIFDICVGDVIDCEIINVNNMGVFAKYIHATVFVPSHAVVNKSNTDVILYEVGDIIKTRIEGKKVSDTIICVGEEITEDSF